MTESPIHGDPARQPQVAARIRLRKGIRGRAVVEELEREGFESREAEAAVGKQLASFRTKAFLFIGGGVLLVALGIGLSICDYYVASRHSGLYIFYDVYVGPILLGMVVAMVGGLRLARSRW